MAAVTDYLKECISDAILALVREKPLHKLTAEEIAQKAGVGRATYFRAFSSREEAVTFKFIRLWDRYADDHGIRVRDRFDLNNALPFFQYNYSIRPLLKAVYDAGLEEAIHESFARIMVPPERTEDAAAAYRETFYAHGLYGLLDGWIRRDFRETPEEMAQMLRDIIQGQ